MICLVGEEMTKFRTAVQVCCTRCDGNPVVGKRVFLAPDQHTADLKAKLFEHFLDNKENPDPDAIRCPMHGTDELWLDVIATSVKRG